MKKFLINDLPSAFLRQQQAEGLKLHKPSAETEKAISAAVQSVFAAFCVELESQIHPPVIGAFVYDMNCCSGDFGKADAITVLSSAGSDDPYFCIGFDCTAAERGDDYLCFLVIHEMCHALAWDSGHSPHYESFLDGMIARFNFVTGRELRNDYSTFNDE